MSLFNDIRKQKYSVRMAFFVLSLFITATLVGFFWFTDIERRTFFAFHPDPQEQAAFIARQNARIPAPVAALGSLLTSMPARIGDFIGFDRSKGFDRPVKDDTVYPLPIVH